METKMKTGGFSRRGVGHIWKYSGGKDMPTLFGSGGPQDGVTALIQSFENRSKEDELALHGNGERVIDDNIFQLSAANANPEFNFSKYKSRSDKVNVTEGVASGDTRVDPYSTNFDQTAQAFGAIFGGVYKLDGRSENDETVEKMGANPFAKLQKKKENDVDIDMGYEGDDDYDIEYYYEGDYNEDGAEQAAINENRETGLRRINMRTSQSRQLERVAQAQDIMKAYEEANDAYAGIVKEHHKHGYMSSDSRKETLERLRTPLSRFESAQVGVVDVSRDNYNHVKNKKQHTTKLNSLIVGV